MSHSNAISLEGFETKPKPIVRIIDDWVTNRNLGMIFEVKIGNGKLLVSGVDLVSDLAQRPEARQLLFSVKKYMESDAFVPSAETKVETIRGLFKTRAELIKSQATAKADNFEKGHEAKNLLDGNPNTLWHSPWKKGEVPLPHTVTIDLGEIVELKGIACLPRQDGNRNGFISTYEVYMSDAPDSKGVRVAQGKFSGKIDRQIIEFKKSQSGRYLTFVATASFGDTHLASLAELDLLMPYAAAS
jgi:hypothetical protein